MNEELEIVKYNDVFSDIEIWLKEKFSYLKNTTIILGYNVLNVELIKKFRPNRKIIIYQLEQFFQGSNWLNAEVLNKLKLADEIWEYDENNISYYKAKNSNIKIVKPDYCENLERVEKHIEKDIDVLFYGDFINYPYRREIIEYLKNNNIKIHTLLNIFGKNLDPYISRSKVVLNMHNTCNKNGSKSKQEQVRIFYLLCNEKCVLSEKSNLNHYGDMIEEWTTKEELLEKINYLLKDDKYKEVEERTKQFKTYKVI